MRLIRIVGVIALLGCGGDDGGAADTDTRSDSSSDSSSDTSGLDVVVVGDGEAVVSWDAPTTRADGSGLMPASLGGYRVHYGTATRSYDTTLDVGRVTSERITGLTPGSTYFFAVTAYDISMRESELSGEAEKAL